MILPRSYLHHYKFAMKPALKEKSDPKKSANQTHHK